MGNEELKFKNDSFKKSRGGHSRWFLLSCAKCKATQFVYQKDGSGILKRLYLDRIVGRARTSCGKCKAVMGMRIMYKKERRPVIRLFVGAIEKQVISANKAKKFVRDSQ